MFELQGGDARFFFEEAGEVLRVDADGFGGFGNGKVLLGHQGTGFLNAQTGQIAMGRESRALPKNRGEIAALQTYLATEGLHGKRLVVAGLHHRHRLLDPFASVGFGSKPQKLPQDAVKTGGTAAFRAGIRIRIDLVHFLHFPQKHGKKPAGGKGRFGGQSRAGKGMVERKSQRDAGIPATGIYLVRGMGDRVPGEQHVEIAFADGKFLFIDDDGAFSLGAALENIDVTDHGTETGARSKILLFFTEKGGGNIGMGTGIMGFFVGFDRRSHRLPFQQNEDFFQHKDLDEQTY